LFWRFGVDEFGLLHLADELVGRSVIAYGRNPHTGWSTSVTFAIAELAGTIKV